MAEPPLPSLSEGVLDAEALDALLDDLAACARVLELRVKADATRRAEAEGPTFAALREDLRARRLYAARVHYAWEGALWTDTLLLHPEGYRLVRMQHPG